MKRKAQVIKTETKSPYFTSSIICQNVNDASFEKGINDASNKSITDQEIASIKRTGKISKYFKSNKKRLIKSTKFSKQEKFSKVVLEAAVEKDLNVDTEDHSTCNSSKLPTIEEAKKAASIVINYIPKFIPMQSPFNLVQETLYYDPWKLLIATMFLNRTRGSQALPLMWKFLEEYPTPQKAVLTNVDTLADLLRPLGLQNIRAERIIRFSYTYLLNPNFKTPKQLFGMGKYAEDSWKLFCEKDDNWMEEYGLESEDRILQLYVNWRRNQYKISKGLIQEEPQNDTEISPENIVKKYENYLSLQDLNNLDISSYNLL